MKKITKNYVLLTCLTTCLAFSAIGAANSVKVASAKADVSATITMQEGAGLLLKEESGLRFSYTVSDYSVDAGKNYGMLIVPYDYLAKAGISLTDGIEDDYVTVLNAAVGKEISYAPIVKENLTPTQEDGKYVFKYSVKNIDTNNYVRQYFGIGFEKTADGNYVYATQDDNVRSVFEVANKALNKLNYGTWTDSESDQAEKANLQAKETSVLNPFITTGWEFVYGTETPTFNVEATYIKGETSPVITAEKLAEKANVTLNVEWHYDFADKTVAEMTNEGNVKGLGRGQTAITASIGTAYELETTASILKDETELQIYNDSENAYFFDSVNSPVVANTYTAQLKGGYWTDYQPTDTYEDPGYLAIKNPNSEDGTYTLDTKYMYVDFYFKGNNMPNVEFFGTTIESLSLGKGSDTTSTKNAPTGYVAFNGAARAETYSKWDALQAAEKDVTNFTVTDDTGAVTGVIDGITTHSNYRFGGLATRHTFFMYGLSDCGTTVNCFSRARYANDTNSSGKGFLRNFDQGIDLTMLYNETSDVSNWATTTVANCSKFSMYSLMNEGEEQYWHYQVGVKLSSKNVPVLQATLWKTDASGNHMDADTSTSETVDAFATYTKKTGAGNITQVTDTKTGYIIVYGALKGSEQYAGTRYNTQLAYTLPYAGA